jgi:ubiquinone/menaquinone biosynthesis C-methylase UbiE
VDDLLKDRPELASGMKFLDVGAGIGLLYEQLRRHIKSDAVYVALEPVANIAHFLKKQFPGVLVLNGDINEAGLPDGVFDAVFVCGVDYLFVDIDAAFRKIARCVKKDGVIVIQRNVFLDQTGYAAKPIRNMTEMFSDNAIIRNWFHSGQYESYLDGIFQIEQRRRAEVSVPFQGTSFRTFTDTYVCTPRPAAPQMYSERPSFLEKSEQLLAELAKGEAALPVAQDPSGQKPLNALSINLGALPGGAKFY